MRCLYTASSMWECTKMLNHAIDNQSGAREEHINIYLYIYIFCSRLYRNWICSPPEGNCLHAAKQGQTVCASAVFFLCIFSGNLVKIKWCQSQPLFLITPACRQLSMIYLLQFFFNYSKNCRKSFICKTQTLKLLLELIESCCHFVYRTGYGK